MEGGQDPPPASANGAHVPWAPPPAPAALPVGHRPGIPPSVGVVAMMKEKVVHLRFYHLEVQQMEVF